MIAIGHMTRENCILCVCTVISLAQHLWIGHWDGANSNCNWCEFSLFLKYFFSHALLFLFSPPHTILCPLPAVNRSAQSGMPKNVCSETSVAWWAPWERRSACRSGIRVPTSPSQLCGLTPPTSSPPPMTFWLTPTQSSPTTGHHSTNLCALVFGASASCTTGAPWPRCASSLSLWPTISTSQYDKVRERVPCDVMFWLHYTKQEWLGYLNKYHTASITDKHSSLLHRWSETYIMQSNTYIYQTCNKSNVCEA